MIERVGLALLLAVATYLFLVQPLRTVLMDFQVYVDAATRFRAGENVYGGVYSEQARDGRIFTLYYFYPPFLAWILSYCVPLGGYTLKQIWCSGSFFCLLYSWRILRELVGKSLTAIRPSRLTLASLFLIICFEPIYESVMNGQINLYVLALLCAFVRTVRIADLSGALAFASAILLKMSPAVLAPALFVLQRGRLLLFSGVICIAASIVLISTAPLETYHDFFLRFAPLFAGTLERHYVFNFALDRNLLKLLGVDSIEPARWIVRSLFLCAYFGLLWLVRGNSHLIKDQSKALAVFGVGVCVMVIAAPTVWFHHFTWLVIPLAILACFGPAPVLSCRVTLRFWTAWLGIYFAISQVNQFHVLALRHAPWLLPVTGLLPSVAIIILASWLGGLALSGPSAPSKGSR